MRIDWIDRYDEGREIAERLKKPAVVVLYTKQCRYCEKLFSVMARNARPASTFFGLPPNRVVELGAQIEL